MFKPFLFSLLLLSAPLPSFSQLGGLIRAIPGGSQPATAAAAAASSPAAVSSGAPDENEGSVQDYLEMRAFAEGLYRKLDGSGAQRRAGNFHRRVDLAYDQLRQAHQDRAYQMNTSAKSEVIHVIEDRFRVYTGLYENPVIQSLMNRVGQSVVPTRAGGLYTFKLVADPVPWAEALSTGTIWVSTGMVSLAENKAQLAFVLAHEAAHVYLEHHRLRVLMEQALAEEDLQRKENGEARQRRFSSLGQAIGTGVGFATGGVAGGNVFQGALAAGDLGSMIGQAIASATNTRSRPGLEWNRFEEDEADRVAFDWLFESRIDVNEVPKIYMALRDIGERDSKISLGFLGRTDRIRERLQNVNARLDQAKARPDWASQSWQRTDADFELVLAEVKRDNGVFAFHKDMMEVARKNLEVAARVKTKDPTALYFYARVLEQTARTEEERNQADDYYRQASENDVRNQNYGAYLHRAIMLLTRTNATEVDKKQAADLLKRYLLGFYFASLDENTAKLQSYPPHLEATYDHLARAGDFTWTLNAKSICKAAHALAAGTLLVQYVEDPAENATLTSCGGQLLDLAAPAAAAPASVAAPPPTTPAGAPPAAPSKPGGPNLTRAAGGRGGAAGPAPAGPSKQK